MEKMEVTNEKKVNKIFGSIKKAFNKDDGEFTAERAWLESTYGVGSNLSTEERIENKQKDIKNIIKSKFRFLNGNCENHSTYSSYRCVIDIEEDLAAYKDIILQPFAEKGFRVINLSEKIDEMEDENVYLISWKNIFKKP